jgi:outer membrane protein assembly factor BamE (lipoprotein component of BamABCDE complex)
MAGTASSRAALAALLLAGCTITRVYVGTPLRADPDLEIQPGVTSMQEVLTVFGPPQRILRHSAGDVFVYSFRRENSETLVIEEPVITDLELFTYSRTREKEDRLVVLFDGEGRVRSFGYQHGTAELDGKKRRADR